jgi:hypothetical protein
VTRLPLRALLALCAILLAACQTGAPAATPTTAAPSAPASETPGSETPGGSEGAPSFSLDLPSFNADRDLEARLPNEIDGVTLTKLSFNGSEFLEDADDNPEFRAMIGALGRTPTDFSMAFAGGEVDGENVQLGAMRVGGVDGQRVLDAFVAASQASTDTTFDIGQANLGGRNVVTLVDQDDPSSGTTYFYASGDLVFFVQADNEALATKGLATLP